MGELLRACWPFVLPGLMPVLALLHVPIAGRRARIVWAALLGAIALAFVVDVLVLPHDDPHTLEVRTMFRTSDDLEPEPIVVDRVTAPAWQWHIATGAWFALTALWAWLRRNGAARAPEPVTAAVVAFLWALLARLALEKTAAPEPIVWGIGITWALFAIAPFFGWYCGRRGHRFGRFLLASLAANALQRLAVVGIGWLATTRALGTHLDVGVLRTVVLPVRGRVELHDPTQAWLWAIAVPQLTFALVFFTVAGAALGVLPWWLARRRAARAPA
jgi:hypothetical protein